MNAKKCCFCDGAGKAYQQDADGRRKYKICHNCRGLGMETDDFNLQKIIWQLMERINDLEDRFPSE